MLIFQNLNHLPTEWSYFKYWIFPPLFFSHNHYLLLKGSSHRRVPASWAFLDIFFHVKYSVKRLLVVACMAYVRCGWTNLCSIPGFYPLYKKSLVLLTLSRIVQPFTAPPPKKKNSSRLLKFCSSLSSPESISLSHTGQWGLPSFCKILIGFQV